MTNRSITINHNGAEYGAELMTIKSTMLGVEDHGILTCFLNCEAQSTGIGVGGYSLDTPVKDENDRHSHREGTAFGMDQIAQIMTVVGVSKWESLPGKHVMVLYAGKGGGMWGRTSAGLAHPTEDRVLILADHAKAWQDRAEMDAEATR